MIRRHNEEHFKIKLRETLEAWNDDYLSKCDAIFLHCPGPFNKQTVFFENGPLNANDSRIRTIAFDTGSQPNFTQVEFAYDTLTSIQIKYN